MANAIDYKNVSVGAPKVGGAIFVAPAGTTLPEDAVTQLSNAFKCVGAISEDGARRGHSMDVQSFYDWDGNRVLVKTSKYEETLDFTAIETNDTSVGLAWGSSNVTATGDNLDWKRVKFNDEEMVIVIELVLSNGYIRRDVIPRGTIIGLGEEPLKNDALIEYPMTIGCMKDSTAGYCSRSFKAKPSAA